MNERVDQGDEKGRGKEKGERIGHREERDKRQDGNEHLREDSHSGYMDTIDEDRTGQEISMSVCSIRNE